jgi:diacylglycerol kinase (ATP)
MFRRIHVIVNPAAGLDRPVLGILNSVFQPSGIDWDVFVTRKAGDARRLAAQSAKAGVDAVAVYGGDGTLMEAVSGIVGSDVPLAILPGGTGNVIAFELGIPGNLADACALILRADSQIRRIDVGQIGETYFLLNAGVGFAAAIAEGAERDSKRRLGMLAYLLSGLRGLRKATVTRYQLTLDGKQIESEGIMCLIANSGNIGPFGIKFAQTIDVSDGLLDVIVIRRGNLVTLLSVAISILTRREHVRPFLHWQAREITLATDPPQTVQVDGERFGKTPFTTSVIPQAARVIVPRG